MQCVQPVGGLEDVVEFVRDGCDGCDADVLVVVGVSRSLVLVFLPVGLLPEPCPAVLCSVSEVLANRSARLFIMIAMSRSYRRDLSCCNRLRELVVLSWILCSG